MIALMGIGTKHYLYAIYFWILYICGRQFGTWQSKVVALSSAEAECRGMTKGLCELLGLRKLLIELGCPSTSATKLFCDNKTAMIFLIIQFSMIEPNILKWKDILLRRSPMQISFNFRL